MAIVYQGEIAGKVCANPDCDWKTLSDFGPARLHGKPVGDGYKSRCRECANAQSRAERTANLEHYRAIERAYTETRKEHYRKLKRAHQQANPEKYDEAVRKYRKTHRNEINASARERRQKDLEHYREIGRNSYERHAEERRKYSLEYYKLHPEKSVEATNRRRAQKLKAGGSHTEDEWQSLILLQHGAGVSDDASNRGSRRSDGACQKCAGAFALATFKVAVAG